MLNYRDYRNIPVDSSYSVYDADMHKQEQRRPVCYKCQEHILDDTAYYINDEWYCPDCVNEMRVYFDE